MKFPVDILLYKVYLQLKNENDTCVTGGTQKNTPTAIVSAKELIDR